MTGRLLLFSDLDFVFLPSSVVSRPFSGDAFSVRGWVSLGSAWRVRTSGGDGSCDHPEDLCYFGEKTRSYFAPPWRIRARVSRGFA
jgi:hypothetical protein